MFATWIKITLNSFFIFLVDCIIDMFSIVTPWSFYSTAAFKQGNLQGKTWYFFVSR